MLPTEPDRSILETAIREAFPKKAEEILGPDYPHPPKWSSIEGCWLFQVFGFIVGVEPDGYVHS